jgi:hypothetical protein
MLLAREEAEWRNDAYQSGRSRRPLRGERATLDDVIAEALLFVQAERRRKNAYRKRRAAPPMQLPAQLVAGGSDDALYTSGDAEPKSR